MPSPRARVMLSFSSPNHLRFLRASTLSSSTARTAYRRDTTRTLPFIPLCRFSTEQPKRKPALRENIYTLPNLLTASRILACPVIGWSVLKGHFDLATSLLVYAGLTDLVCSSPSNAGYNHSELNVKRQMDGLLVASR